MYITNNNSVPNCILDRITFVQTFINSGWGVVNLNLHLLTPGIEILLQAFTFVSCKHTGFGQCRNDSRRERMKYKICFQ